MRDLNILLHGFSLSLACLLSCQALISFKVNLAAKMLFFWSLFVAVYIFEIYLVDQLSFHVISYTILLTPLVTVFYWLFCSSLFDDDFTWSRWHPFLACCVLVFSNLAYYTEAYKLGEWSHFVIKCCHKASHLTVIVLAFWSVIKDWSQELNKNRNILRFVGLVIGGSYLLLFTMFFNYSLDILTIDHAYSFYNNIFILILLFFFNLIVMQEGKSFFKTLRKPPYFQQTSFDAKLTAHLNKITTLMEEQKIFRNETLSLGELSHQAKIPEYLLRKTINQRLGYNNFRDFINYYRTKEAAKLLEDPEKNQEKIITIAFEVGFSSLAPFNKAFKKNFGRSPSEYRQAKDRG